MSGKPTKKEQGKVIELEELYANWLCEGIRPQFFLKCYFGKKNIVRNALIPLGIFTNF